MLAKAVAPGQVISQYMSKSYCIKLDENDLGQLLDGLESRAEVWEKTGDYLLSGLPASGEFFLAEDCHRPEEAFGIAEHYRSIIRKIRTQMDAQVTEAD